MGVKKEVNEERREEKTLEEMLGMLDEHIKQLESEDISLEESFRVYEKGMHLIQSCNEKIDRVEKKVLELNDNGTLQELL